jgi:diguanylate cyclase (GGDEF)-like protein
VVVVEKNLKFSSKWHKSLQFKISAMFLIFFLLIASALFLILKTIGNELIEEQAYLQLEKAEHEVVSVLKGHTILAATLVDAMANLAEKLPKDVDLHKTLLIQLLNNQGSDTIIAGGGVWPAPFQFDADTELYSFFWGRNPNGGLQFYDDYNRQTGNGYYHEEWYVPATQLAKGGLYWSKSYTDPYSLQPMVTVTTPMFKAGVNVGVATIDLKLDGLQLSLDKITNPFGGYAFVVDRNGTFLSYPDINQVIATTKNSEGGELTSFINYRALAQKSLQFREFAAVLDKKSNNLLESVGDKSQLKNQLASKLIRESPQISSKEADLIAASMLYSAKNSDNGLFKYSNLYLPNDPLLNEPVFVSLSTMPGTYWKIVTVMPYSKSIEKFEAIYDRFTQATFTVVLLTFFIIWLLIRSIVTVPILHICKQIQSQVDSKVTDMKLLKTSAKDELFALVQVFNQRTSQLLEMRDEIKKLAHFDELTGLVNRRLLIERLDEKLAIAQRQHCSGALMFIDLDNFKLINDSLGHDMGDELLVGVAKRFQKCIRVEDTVARLGGDEFVVLITKYNESFEKLRNEATIIAEKLVHAMKEPFVLQGHQYKITVSIGITIFSGENIASDELLSQADTAMYRAKNNGKNGFCFFTPKMLEQVNWQLNKLAAPNRNLDG